MAENAQGDPSVMDQAQPAAVPPNAPAVSQDETASLRAKLELVQSDRLKQGETNKKLNEQFAELRGEYEKLQKKVLSGKTQKMEEAGEHQRLWEDAKVTISQKEMRIQELEDQLQNERQGRSQERLKSRALSAIGNSGSHSPEQLYQLMAQNLRETDAGDVVCINGGVEQPLNDRLAQLRNQGSGFEHFFSAPNGVGMGSAAPAAGSAMPGMSNPWKAETWNLTAQLSLEAQDQQLAQLLKSEAGG